MAEIDDDELRELQARAERADAAELRSAREQALREHPLLSMGMLETLTGSPSDILKFAATLEGEIQARQPAAPSLPPLAGEPPAPQPPAPTPPVAAGAPVAFGASPSVPPGYQLVPIGPVGEPPGASAPVAPVVPTPSPGSGQAPSMDGEIQAHKADLRMKVLDKRATQEEANELAGIDMMQALTAIGQRRAASV